MFFLSVFVPSDHDSLDYDNRDETTARQLAPFGVFCSPQVSPSLSTTAPWLLTAFMLNCIVQLQAKNARYKSQSNSERRRQARFQAKLSAPLFGWLRGLTIQAASRGGANCSRLHAAGASNENASFANLRVTLPTLVN